MTNKKIGKVLNQTASLIELTGGNAFRARAFQRAARTIDRLDQPVTELVAEGTLTTIPGIGKGLAAQIEECVARGSFGIRDELLDALPAGLLDTLRVKGLGAKKVRRLWVELGITNLNELEQAATIGRLASLDGFGAKSESNILEQIRLLKQYQSKRHYAAAYHLIEPLINVIRQFSDVERVELAGEMRRKLEVVESVDLLIATNHFERVREFLSDLEGFTATEKKGELIECTLSDGLPLRIRLVPPKEFGTAWWYSTGSASHIKAYEDRFGTPPVTADEAVIYSHAKLYIVDPELREDDGEFEAAGTRSLPTLITVADLKGSLHNHSTYSDGAHSLRAMADFAYQMGLSYFGICDHSRSLKIAHGMSIEQVQEQQAEIQALNDEMASTYDRPFRIFSGIESDILADGSLDYPEPVLASFDFIVASVHTRFNMTEEEATHRVIRAVENPHTSILGHATGRLLLAREGYPLNHEDVITACAANNVAIELNANPYRLDLDWRWIKKATQQGVLISINPDAHAMEQLPYVKWGIAVARKGWLSADQCLNAMNLETFTAWLKNRKKVVVD